jgi:hypothetical protein
MKGLPEELIYALGFVALLLLQYLMKRFGPQQQQQQQQQQQSPQDEPDPEPLEQVQATPQTSPVSALSDIRFGQSGALRVSSPVPRARFSRMALMGTRREVQNAIAIATILGPCRAYEPHS